MNACDRKVKQIGSFWLANDSPRFSKTFRSMLQLRHDLQLDLCCSIGDGKTTLFWYDYWIEMGPLYTLFGQAGPRDLRIPLTATVSQAVHDGHQNLPPARSEYAETLQVILSSTDVPCNVNGKDAYLWRNQSGGFGGFSLSRVTWELTRTPQRSFRGILLQFCSVVIYLCVLPLHGLLILAGCQHVTSYISGHIGPT